jgi:hypothetical protein
MSTFVVADFCSPHVPSLSNISIRAVKNLLRGYCTSRVVSRKASGSWQRLMTRIGLKVAGLESGDSGYGLIVKRVVKGALGVSRPLEEFRLRFEDGCDVVSSRIAVSPRMCTGVSGLELSIVDVCAAHVDIGAAHGALEHE